MSATGYTTITPRYGGTGGTAFSDSLPFGDLATANINRIIVRHNLFSWENGEGITHGTSSDGGKDDFTLKSDEYITGIEGWSTRDYVTQLTFITNKRKLGPYGGYDGAGCTWSSAGRIHSGSEPLMKIIAFNGYADQYLYGLQAVFTVHREHTCKSVLYERMGEPTQAASLLSSSKFTSHLMAPIVTLFVGPLTVEFHAHEDTLCKLPFSEAALLGKFKEALQKTIDMPEDDPTKISPLIEYLYTENYTYPYDPTTVHFKETSEFPVSDLTEGSFHVGVYAVATKYICTGLAEIAMRNFWAVLAELGNIEKLHLWKEAYDAGIYIPRQKTDFPEHHTAEGLVLWVGGLFREHGEEMEKTMSEYPVLACDLLRIATRLD